MRFLWACLVCGTVSFAGCATYHPPAVTDRSVLPVVGRSKPTATHVVKPDAPAKRTEVPVAMTFSILPRSGWAGGAPKPRSMKAMGRIYRMTIHHEGCAEPNTLVSESEVAKRLRDTAKDHMIGRGWSDIGYHFAVDRAGRVWECRSTSYQGAHAGDAANRGNIGIEVLGNFDLQTPTPAQRRALASLVVKLCSQYGIGPSQIYTHRELATTDCPGRTLQAYVSTLRQEMKATANR